MLEVIDVSEQTQKKSRMKFGARLVRAFVYGQVLGFPLALLSYAFAVAINKLSGATIIDPSAMALIGYGVGIAAPIGIEISKEAEE